MIKKIKKLLALGIVVGSITTFFSINIANANDIDSMSVKKASQDVLDKRLNEIVNNPSYETNTTTEVKYLDEDTKLVIESVNYEKSSDGISLYAISNGTNFGNYSSIKIYSVPYNSYMGTVSIDAQGQKISSTTAKINYIRYSNSGFASFNKGAYQSSILTQGNPATGFVAVSYSYYFDSQYVGQTKFINVKAYPTGNITIG
jgi:hypothetical protein